MHHAVQFSRLLLLYDSVNTTLESKVEAKWFRSDQFLLLARIVNKSIVERSQFNTVSVMDLANVGNGCSLRMKVLKSQRPSIEAIKIIK